MRVFEVDQPTIFDVKEPIIKSVGHPLAVANRTVVPYEFTAQRGQGFELTMDGGVVDLPTDQYSTSWADSLIKAGFDPKVPTVWLLEGLLMYLSMEDTKFLMQEVGRISAKGSAVFHD